jgi:hypothetical protein
MYNINIDTVESNASYAIKILSNFKAFEFKLKNDIDRDQRLLQTLELSCYVFMSRNIHMLSTVKKS